MATSLDFPALLNVLAETAAGTDEGTAASNYAGIPAADLILALNKKAGTTGKDLPEVLCLIMGTAKGTDANISLSGGRSGGVTNSLVQEDGTSLILLEDGTYKLLLEVSN